MLNAKLCIMVLLIELYLFILLSVTWIIFQGCGIARQFRLKKKKFLSDKVETSYIVIYIMQIMNMLLCLNFRKYSREISDVFPDLTQTLTTAFS